MEIKQVRELRDRLAAEIDSMITDFEKASGVRVESVEINHIDVTQLQDPGEESVCQTTINLESL